MLRSSFKKKGWWLLLSVFIIIESIGLYFLIQSYIDPQSKETSKLFSAVSIWNLTLPEFSELHPELLPNTTFFRNHTDHWGSDVDSFPDYEHLFFSVYTPLDTSNLTTHYSNNSIEFNVTTNLFLSMSVNGSIVNSTVSDVLIHSRRNEFVNMKVCRNSNIGYWDGTRQSCLYSYNTAEICLIVDQGVVVSWYEKGCDANGYVKQQVVPWTEDKPYTNYSFKILIMIKSDKDPHVYAAFNDLITFSSNPQEYQIIGGTLMTFAAFFLLVSCYLSYKQRKSPNYDNMV